MSDILKEIKEMRDEAIKYSDQRSLREVLRERRISLGLKLSDIARISGLSESLVGKIESDKVDDIKISTMKKLSLAYNIHSDIFIARMGFDDSLLEIINRASATVNARKILSKRVSDDPENF